MNARGILLPVLVALGMFAVGCGKDEVTPAPAPTFQLTLSILSTGPVTVETSGLKGEGSLQKEVVDNNVALIVADNAKDKNVLMKFVAANGNDFIRPFMATLGITFPTIHVYEKDTQNSCFLSRDDFTEIDGFFQANITVDAERNISASDCENRSVELRFDLISLSESNVLDCDVEGFGVYRQPFTGQQTYISDGLIDRDYVCRVFLSNGANIIKEGHKLPGQGLLVQGVDLPEDSIRLGKSGIEGFAFHVNTDRTVTPLTDEMEKVAVDFVEPTLVVKSYAGVLAVNANCTFLSQLPVAPMTQVLNQHNYTYTFPPTKTNATYTCTFTGPNGGQLDPTQLVLIVEGVQVVGLNGVYTIQFDEFGDPVVQMVERTYMIAPTIELLAPVYMHIGNLGDFITYEMQYLDGRWVATVTLPIGIYEANVSYNGGAYKVLYPGPAVFPASSAPVADGTLFVGDSPVSRTFPYAHAYYWWFDLTSTSVDDHPGNPPIVDFDFLVPL